MAPGVPSASSPAVLMVNVDECLSLAVAGIGEQQMGEKIRFEKVRSAFQHALLSTL